MKKSARMSTVLAAMISELESADDKSAESTLALRSVQVAKFWLDTDDAKNNPKGLTV